MNTFDVVGRSYSQIVRQYDEIISSNYIQKILLGYVILTLLFPLTVYAIGRQTASLQSISKVASTTRVVELLQSLQPEATIVEQIRDIAVKNGVDASLALNIACAESNFNEIAKNPSSTAGGVYQWLDSSWQSNVTKYWGKDAQLNKYDATDNITLSIVVLREAGTRDWDASKYSGYGGGWAQHPFERGLCNFNR